MNDRLANLAGRKELLIARSRLHRLQLQHQTRSLRRSIARPATMLSLAASAPVRPLLFSALLFIAGRGRMARILRGAMAALAIAKAAGVVMGQFSRAGGTTTYSPPAPKIQTSRLAPHPDPRDPAHAEWLIDAGVDGSFPASDPSAAAQPHPSRR